MTPLHQGDCRNRSNDGNESKRCDHLYTSSIINTNDKLKIHSPASIATKTPARGSWHLQLPAVQLLLIIVPILALHYRNDQVSCQPEDGSKSLSLSSSLKESKFNDFVGRIKKPPGAECLLYGDPSQVQLVRLQDTYELQLNQSLNNTMQVYRGTQLALTNRSSRNQQQQPQQPQPTSNSKALQMFASICNGWMNSVELSDGRKQLAYWVLDSRRQALVAKFNYFDPLQSYDYSGLREARLTSPIFRPIPAYHSMSDSKYYASCKFTFRSYQTLSSHLDLYLITVPTSGGSNLLLSPLGNDQQQHQQRKLKQLIENGKGLALASERGEQAVWSTHTVDLPTDFGEKSLYRLEFSALNSIQLRSDITTSYNFLKGIAVANFSLSPQCFGLEVEPEELERVYKLTGENPLDYSKSLGFTINSSLAGTTGGSSSRFPQQISGNARQLIESRQSYLVHLYETYKGLLFWFIVVILVILVASTQYLLCLYHQNKNSPPGHGGNSSTSGWNSMFFCWCCYNYCPILTSNTNNRKQRSQFSSGSSQNSTQLFGPHGRLRVKRRHRVYVSSLTNDTGASAQNNNQRKGNNRKYSNEEQIKLKEVNEELMLRRLGSEPENYELEGNINYRPNGGGLNCAGELNSLHTFTGNSMISNNNGKMINGLSSLAMANCASLEPYQIDRERLTFTQPSLGRGAFGEVHRGCLACYYSTDDSGSLTLLNDKQLQQKSGRHQDSHELDHLESQSIKVAIKTLTDDRMSQEDFIREAINMSQVSHRNIVEFIGVCFERRPLYIVMELLEGGNLKQFLLKNRDKISTGGGSNQSSNLVQISNSIYSLPDPNARARLNMGDLLVFALDIAKACDYLQRQQFIHRDLAARNVLLTRDTKSTWSSPLVAGSPNGPSSSPFLLDHENSTTNLSHTNNARRNFVSSPPSALDVEANHKVDLEQVYLNGYRESGIVAKLADFGMTRDVYSNNYYRFGGKELPVRWMPPECLDGVATTKSDVWSFGVFLWEVFSMGQLPYQHLLDNQKVIEYLKSRRCARPRDSLQYQLQQPQPQSYQVDSGKEMELLLTISSENIATSANITPLPPEDSIITERDSNNQKTQASSSTNTLPLGFISQNQSQNQKRNRNNSISIIDSDLGPPLPPPHENTPHPIYSIMCSCWAINPEERPQFEEIANRLYWCLQMDEVLGTSLPCFYEQQRHSSTGRPTHMMTGSNNDNNSGNVNQHTQFHQEKQQQQQQRSQHSIQNHQDHRLSVGSASDCEASEQQEQYLNQLSANNLNQQTIYLNQDDDDDDENRRILSPDSDVQSTYLAAASQTTQVTQLNWW